MPGSYAPISDSWHVNHSGGVGSATILERFFGECRHSLLSVAGLLSRISCVCGPHNSRSYRRLGYNDSPLVRFPPRGGMSLTKITQYNVGRIAERIVANELEYRGFRVSDLNKEGTSSNADLLAACEGQTMQIQVKGLTCNDKEGWWFGYGHSSDAVLARTESMFNRSGGSFYKAEVVVLVGVKSPQDYHCLVLPEHIAESAAQMNLDGWARRPKKDGSRHKPGKMWVSLDWISKSKTLQ